MPSTYIEPIEDAIATRLQSLENDGLKIDNSPSSGVARPSARALIYLSSIDADASQGKTSQTDSMSYEISLELTDQRSHQKAYPFIEGIRNLLSGHSINGHIVRFNGVQFQSTQDSDGIRWRYLLRFSLRSMWVAPNRK